MGIFKKFQKKIKGQNLFIYLQMRFMGCVDRSKENDAYKPSYLCGPKPLPIIWFIHT